jgi:hypothetical protein
MARLTQEQQVQEEKIDRKDEFNHGQDSSPPDSTLSLFCARLLHRTPHPFRDKSSDERLDFHLDAGAIQRGQGVGFVVSAETGEQKIRPDPHSQNRVGKNPTSTFSYPLAPTMQLKANVASELIGE